MAAVLGSYRNMPTERSRVNAAMPLGVPVSAGFDEAMPAAFMAGRAALGHGREPRLTVCARDPDTGAPVPGAA